MAGTPHAVRVFGLTLGKIDLCLMNSPHVISIASSLSSIHILLSRGGYHRKGLATQNLDRQLRILIDQRVASANMR